MKKVKFGYLIVFITIIVVLCLVMYYFRISIENIDAFSNKSLKSIFIINYAYKNDYNMSEINDNETIDKFIEFLNDIKIQRRLYNKLNNEIFSYNHDENGEYDIIIKDENNLCIEVNLYNRNYIGINNRLYKVISNIDYDLLNSFIK